MLNTLKFWLLVFCLFLIARNVYSAPFLIADVPSTADTCVYTDNAGNVITSLVVVDAALGNPTFANRICKLDMAASPVGTNNVKLRVRNVASAPLWGDSVDVPFSFVRPVAVAPPSTPRLTP